MTGIRRNWLWPICCWRWPLAMAGPSGRRRGVHRCGSGCGRKAGREIRSQAQPIRSGHVYLLRGLLNIFSLGMDDLAAKIQAKGISASVHNHSEWQALADDIAVKYKAGQHGPVVLVGHSLGADAVMFMAEYLGKKGVPVALVVPFDGTGSFAASSNVGQVINLTQRDYAHMRKGAGFRGQLSNIDVSDQGYGHIDIDKSARLHTMVLSRIQAVLGRGGGARSAQSEPRCGRWDLGATHPSGCRAAPVIRRHPRQNRPLHLVRQFLQKSAPPAAAPKPQAGVATTSGISNERAVRPNSPVAPKPASAPAASGAAPAKPALRF